jgi:hypothetical protein
MKWICRWWVLGISLVGAGAACGADLPRVVGIDIGGGVPELVAADVQVLVASHWQIGMGYGFIPGLGPISSLKIPDQSINLSVGTFSVSSQVSASLSMLTPFIRYFPTERNYYLQFAFSMLRAGFTVNSAIEDSFGAPLGATITANVNVIQPVPTLSLGHIFASQAYFLNLNLGVSFLLSPWVSSSISGSIPDILGGTTANQAAINSLQSKISSAVTNALQSAQQQVFLIPSITITFGIFL